QVTISDFTSPPNTVTSSFSIAIQPLLAITTTNLSSGSVGSFYVDKLDATGGVPPYTFAVDMTTGLPSGLSVQNNRISGVPMTEGQSTPTFIVSDSQRATSSRNLDLTITAQNCPKNGNMQGQYAFLFSGANYFRGPEPANYVGSFVADGAGHISGGTLDSA